MSGYALDVTGVLPANQITNEMQTITAANYQDFSFLIPQFAPFFGNSMSVSYVDGGGVTHALVEGTDYLLSLPFVGASGGCATPIYGAVSFLNLSLNGTIKFNNYQTLGGNYTLSTAQLTALMANLIYNPRVTTWEQINSLPNDFPPTPHTWDLINLVGMSDVSTALQQIAASILTSINTGANAHFTNYSNPHEVTAAQIGLDLVQNFPIATLAQAIAGTSASAYITPITMAGAISTAVSATASTIVLLSTGLSSVQANQITENSSLSSLSTNVSTLNTTVSAATSNIVTLNTTVSTTVLAESSLSTVVASLITNLNSEIVSLSTSASTLYVKKTGDTMSGALNNPSGFNGPLTGGADVAEAVYHAGSGVSMVFHWTATTGQPNWLWGGSGSGTDMYVYNPSNFSVNYANSAGSAGNGVNTANTNFSDIYTNGNPGGYTDLIVSNNFWFTLSSGTLTLNVQRVHTWFAPGTGGTGGGGTDTGCFTFNTHITLIDGTLIPIADLQIGMFVKTRNGQDRVIGVKKVQADPNTTIYSPNDYAPFLTLNHPYFNDDNTLCAPAKDAEVSSPWLGEIKLTQCVTAKLDDGATVYNVMLETADNLYANEQLVSNLVSNGGFYVLNYLGYLSNDGLNNFRNIVKNMSRKQRLEQHIFYTGLGKFLLANRGTYIADIVGKTYASKIENIKDNESNLCLIY